MFDISDSDVYNIDRFGHLVRRSHYPREQYSKERVEMDIIGDIYEWSGKYGLSVREEGPISELEWEWLSRIKDLGTLSKRELVKNLANEGVTVSPVFYRTR